MKEREDLIKSAILDVLLMQEEGGALFRRKSPFPSFMLDRYLRSELFELLNSESLYYSCSSYMLRDPLYLMTLKHLGRPVSEMEFDRMLFMLHQEKKVFISIEPGSPVKIYRYQTAEDEYESARTLSDLMQQRLKTLPCLLKTVTETERKEHILLSDEQRSAVIKAMQNPISIITGGPGTGKTSIQKVILSVYRYYFPNKKVLLCSPTGKAAKRMSQQTGLHAMTIHKALGFTLDKSGMFKENCRPFDAGLILVDESSMIGAHLLCALLKRVPSNCRLIFSGDCDQLPSIEAGASLKEMIGSGIIPVTRLTLTFRQAEGSSIITNGARIRRGENRLIFDDSFRFIECEDSKEIAEKAKSLYPALVSKYGADEVLCLTALRRKTVSGANALNKKLRMAVNPDHKNGRWFETGGIRIYEGDRVINVKNTALLSNGDLGTVKRIAKMKDSLIVSVNFGGDLIALKDKETENLELAYAMTVHKSQGSEAKAVILTADMAHKAMLKRNLFYTGITRAKKRIYILGQKDALDLCINTPDSVNRNSDLGKLIRKYYSDATSLCEGCI